jgi:hypothetical protein
MARMGHGPWLGEMAPTTDALHTASSYNGRTGRPAGMSSNARRAIVTQTTFQAVKERQRIGWQSGDDYPRGTPRDVTSLRQTGAVSTHILSRTHTGSCNAIAVTLFGRTPSPDPTVGSACSCRACLSNVVPPASCPSPHNVRLWPQSAMLRPGRDGRGGRRERHRSTRTTDASGSGMGATTPVAGTAGRRQR